MFSESSACLLGQHGRCSSAQLPVKLSENIFQNLLHNLPPQTVFYIRNVVHASFSDMDTIITMSGRVITRRSYIILI